MLENFTIPAGFKEVPAEDLNNVLSLSGSRNAMYFFNGDTIKCSDKVLCTMREVTKDGKKTPTPIYYLVCEINNGRPKAVPFASFRRFPREADDFLAKSTLMRSLYGGSDADRFDLIKGKTLVVDGLYEGEAIDWQKSNLDTREFVYKPAKFPILKEK